MTQQADSDWYIGKQIKNVEFEGLATVESKDLQEIVDPFVGQPFELDMFFEMQTALYATELFESLEADASEGDPDRSNVIIRWSVKERPTIEEVIVAGNRRLREGQIIGVMVSKVGTILNTRQIDRDVEAIRALYQDDGFGSTDIQSEISTNTENNTVNLLLTIEEGIRTVVDEIRFVGNDFASASTLRNQMSTRQRALLQRGLFSEQVFQLDIEQIINYYRSNGYINFAVEAVGREIKHDEQAGEDLLTLTLNVVEGRSFSYLGTEFKGNAVFSNEELQALIRHRPDRPVNLATIDLDYLRVQEMYFENGYIFNEFKKEFLRDEEQGKLLVLITISERDGAHIENISITGNEKTQEHVIRRELPFVVGDVFNRTAVIRGLQNIYNLQFFAEVEPDTPPGSSPGLIDVNIAVEETKTADIGFGATFSGGDFPLSGFVRWSERNFRGLGQTVGVDLFASQLRQSVSLNFQEPWLLGLPWSAGVTVGGEHSVVLRVPQDVLHPVFTDDEFEYAVPDPFISNDEYSSGDLIPEQYTMKYDTFALSAGVSSGFRFDTFYGWINVNGGFNSRLEFLRYDPEVNRPFDKAIRDQFQRWSVVNTLSASLTWDRRDFFLNPTDGTLLSQDVILTGGFLSGDRHYVLLNSRAQGYATILDVPISDGFDVKLILAGHAGFSVILPQLRRCSILDESGGLCWDQVTSSEDLLVIDGNSIGRGWEQVIDGQARWEGKIELRAPLDPQLVWGVAFLDSALLWTDRGAIGATALDDVYFSTGFGLRFAIPQLPLRFYLAKPFRFEDGKIIDPGGNDDLGTFGGMNFVLAFGGDNF